MLPFAIVLTPLWIAVIVLSALCAALLASWLFKKDDAIERRREEAIEAAAELKKFGWDQLADVLIKYAIGDYSGLLGEIRALRKQIMDSDKARALVGNAIVKGLPEVMKDDVWAAKVRKVLGLPAEPESVPAAPAVPTTKP